jgi:hypothetical protein
VNDPLRDTQNSQHSMADIPSELTQCEEHLFSSDPGQRWQGRDRIFNGNQCVFARFENFMAVLMQNGLTAELIASPSGSKAAGASASSSAPPSESKGRICFDQALVLQELGVSPTYLPKGFLGGHTTELCGNSSTKAVDNSTSAGTNTTVRLQSSRITKSDPSKDETTQKYDLTKTVQTTPLKPKKPSNPTSDKLVVRIGGRDAYLAFAFRSPIGVYRYYGKLLDSSVSAPRYSTDVAIKLIGQEPFVNVVANDTQCYTSINYMGGRYCVPEYSMHTAMLLDVLQELRNLSTQPSDLNSAFTVRLSGT